MSSRMFSDPDLDSAVVLVKKGFPAVIGLALAFNVVIFGFEFLSRIPLPHGFVWLLSAFFGLLWLPAVFGVIKAIDEGYGRLHCFKRGALMSVHFLTPPLMLALVFFSVLLTVFSNGLLDIDSRGGLLQGAIMGNTIGNAVAMSGYMLLSGLEALVVPATLFMHAPDRKKAVAWSKKASADMRYIAIFALMVYATLPVPVFIKGVFYIVFVAVLYACFKRKCVEFGPLE